MTDIIEEARAMLANPTRITDLRNVIRDLADELSEARWRYEALTLATKIFTEDAFAEAVERIASVQHVRWVDSVTGEYMESIRGLSRALAADGVAAFFNLLRMWSAEQKRDALADECERLSASLDAMTNQAVMASGRRATIVTEDGELERLRAENARLREVVPTEEVEKDIDYLLSCIDGHPNVADEYERVSEWLARLDAAKGVR